MAYQSTFTVRQSSNRHCTRGTKEREVRFYARSPYFPNFCWSQNFGTIFPRIAFCFHVHNRGSSLVTISNTCLLSTNHSCSDFEQRHRAWWHLKHRRGKYSANVGVRNGTFDLYLVCSSFFQMRPCECWVSTKWTVQLIVVKEGWRNSKECYQWLYSFLSCATMFCCT